MAARTGGSKKRFLPFHLGLPGGFAVVCGSNRTLPDDMGIAMRSNVQTLAPPHLRAGRFWPLTSELPIESTNSIRVLQSKFPAKWNREIIVPEQGIKSADQGSFYRIREDRAVRANLPERATERAFERGSGDLAAIRLSPSGDGELTQDLLYRRRSKGN